MGGTVPVKEHRSWMTHRELCGAVSDKIPVSIILMLWVVPRILFYGPSNTDVGQK